VTAERAPAPRPPVGGPAADAPGAPARGGARARLGVALAAAALAALLAVPPLGRAPVVTSDEARFPLLARDMLARGAWFDATLRGRLYRNKPPLYPWSIAAVARLTGGVTEAAAGVPVVCAYVAAVAAVTLLGARLFDPVTGAWAGLVLATAYGVFQHSQKLLPDMLVVAFATVAGWAFWTAATGPRPGPWLVVFYLALGLGVFAKGPVGLLPLAAAAAWLVAARGWRGLARLWSGPGALVFAGLTLGWLVPFLARGAGSFGRDVLVTDWLRWYLGRPRLGADVLVDAVVGFLPWTLVVPLAVGAAWRARAEPALAFALLWLAVPLASVLAAANYRARYLLPVYPGAALLVAWWWRTRARIPGAAARAVGALAVAAGAAGALALLAGWLPAEHFLRRPRIELLPLVAGSLVLGLALGIGLTRGRPALAVYGAGAAMALGLAYGALLHADWVRRTQPLPALAARLAERGPDSTPGVFGGRYYALDYYLGRPLVRLGTLEAVRAHLARPDRAVVVMPARAWAALEASAPPGATVVDRARLRGTTLVLVQRAAGPQARPAAPALTPGGNG